MAERFYANCPLGPGAVRLEGPEAHHLALVCRARPGIRVCLFNGDGREYLAEVTQADRRRVDLTVLSGADEDRELGFALEVAAPLPKGDRAQFLVEKLTELGVTRFIPLRTRYSVVHPREAKVDRLARHVIEASKQCGRNVLMEIEPLTDWASYCAREDLPGLRLIAHPGEAAETWPPRQPVAVAIGPEGGFSPEEVQVARGWGWRLIGLGPRILRVETAALVLAIRASNPGWAGP